MRAVSTLSAMHCQPSNAHGPCRYHCCRRNAEVVLLEVRASNQPAMQLYKSMGFQRVGLRQEYYHDGEDAVLMTLELAQHGQ